MGYFGEPLIVQLLVLGGLLGWHCVKPNSASDTNDKVPSNGAQEKKLFVLKVD